MEKKEYIERGALIEWLKSCKNACIEVCKGLNNNIEEYAAENVIEAYDDCIGYVESAPAADVVEVVRCKDCVWREIRGLPGTVGRCENPHNGLWNEYTYACDYCSYGERKEE